MEVNAPAYSGDTCTQVQGRIAERIYFLWTWKGYRHAVYASSQLCRCWKDTRIAIYGSQVTYTTVAERLRVSTLKVDQP